MNVNKHEQFLAQAVALAFDSIEHDGGPFGAVIVHKGQVIATGSNEVTKQHDPTAHAEVVAIRRACAALKNHELRGCVLYSSCEPCPMCLGAIYWARLDGVWYSAGRNDAARVGFSDAMIYHEIGVDPGQRSIPMRQLKVARYDEVFRSWQDKPDKSTY